MPAPLASLLAPDVLLDLFDALPETMFYVKDTRGRYVTVNRTMLDRSGLSRREDVLNRTAADLFPGALGENYTRDDLLVIARGEAIRDRLEMYHPQRGRGASVNVGWCLTHKLPLRDPSGVVVGLAGVSRDLPRPDERSQTYAQVASVAARVRASPGEP
ncbi:PAS domain-containing protein, partial [Deinococcus pimensis]|uniref:PAS domain-containing protein n=1 Tax=Deinococcus pimensis TaxID=309888 RepID=UPI0005EB0CAE